MAEYVFRGANPVCVSEIKEIKERFPSYASANVTGKAKDSGVERVMCGTGDYVTRCAYVFDSEDAALYDYDCIAFADEFGELDGAEVECGIWGIRASVQILYDEKSKVVASCKQKERTAFVHNDETNRIEKVSSVAPIVMFGKKEYIWMNIEECKANDSPVMRLVGVKIIDGYYPVNDPLCDKYSNLEELQDWCFEAVTEFCSDEEKKSIVSVVMTDEDNFESAKPILEKVEKQDAKFDMVGENKIDDSSSNIEKADLQKCDSDGDGK